MIYYSFDTEHDDCIDYVEVKYRCDEKEIATIHTGLEKVKSISYNQDGNIVRILQKPDAANEEILIPQNRVIHIKVEY